MRSMLDIWRSIRSKFSLKAGDSKISDPRVEPFSASYNFETERVMESNPKPSSRDPVSPATGQDPNVIIFVPPPPEIRWPYHELEVQAPIVLREDEKIVAETPVEEVVRKSTVEEAPSSDPAIEEDIPVPATEEVIPGPISRHPDPPQTKDEYVEYAEEFVSNNIENFTQVTEETVKSVAELAATQADIVAAELELRPEIVPQLVKLAFYDFVILCDDSYSMTFDPQHIPALNDTLRRVAHFATLLQPKGISIRFLNHKEGTSGHYDDLTDARDIAAKVANVPFYGNTRLGQILDEKIVRPMITERIASGRLERPVFVVIITDGQPTDEPTSALRDTICNCRNTLSRHAYKGAAAIFLISQIGTDNKATLFLHGLETDPQISSMVFCSTENLAAKLAQFKSSGRDKQYTAWLIDLFLAALDKQTKHS